MGLFGPELNVSEKIGAEVADCFKQDAGGVNGSFKSNRVVGALPVLRSVLLPGFGAACRLQLLPASQPILSRSQRA